MRIHKDCNFEHLAARIGGDKKDVEQNIIKSVLGWGLADDTAECWGNRLRDVIEPETEFTDICEAIKEIGIENIRYTDYEAFVKLTIKGSGNCPDCGGEMKRISETGFWDGDGWNTPRVYVMKSAVFECPVCGCQIEEDY